MKNIAIVDYGMCNLDSVSRAVDQCGGTPVITDDPVEIRGADGIILPGVGAFADAMSELDARGLVEALRTQALRKETPFLGICLGMQLMATVGFEGGETPGLDLIPGQVVRLVPDPPGTRIPHVGWNEVHVVQDSPLFSDLPPAMDCYFVHSYHYECDDAYILARTPYCGTFASAVGIGHCFGVQFHPEKSSRTGFAILTNFLALC